MKAIYIFMLVKINALFFSLRQCLQISLHQTQDVAPINKKIYLPQLFKSIYKLYLDEYFHALYFVPLDLL